MNRARVTGRPGDTRGAARQGGTSGAGLVRIASAQVTLLLRKELRLARLEMAAKARYVGIGVGLFGAAGVIALYGLAALIVTLLLLLALVMPAWLAGLLITVVLSAAALVMALLGQDRIRRVGSMVPQQAVDSVKADVRAVTRALRKKEMTVGTKNGTRIRSGETLSELGDTVEAIADKADVSDRAGEAVRHAAAQTREGGQQAVEQVGQSVRRDPARWASVGAGVVATAAATVGALRWRQARRTPRGRAARLWSGVTDRFGR